MIILTRVITAQRELTAAANSSTAQAVLGAQLRPMSLSASLGPSLPVTSFMDPGPHPLASVLGLSFPDFSQRLLSPSGDFES